jgi:hypothetical protein
VNDVTPSPPIFNLNAYNPAEIQEAIETVGVKKAAMPVVPCFVLAVVAGGSIGFGALYYSIVASDADLSFATVRRARWIGVFPGHGNRVARRRGAFYRQQLDCDGLGER